MLPANDFANLRLFGAYLDILIYESLAIYYLLRNRERMTKSISTQKKISAGIRLWCLGGALLTGSLLYLGIYPSLFTILAILVLPSPILFLVAVVRPSLFQNHRALRFYLVGCSIAAVLSWLYELWWLSQQK